MPARLNGLEKECLECTLPICDDRSAKCKFVQITGWKEPITVRQRALRGVAGRRRAKAERELKEDIIQILGRIVGELAVDRAKREAASVELING